MPSRESTGKGNGKQNKLLDCCSLNPSKRQVGFRDRETRLAFALGIRKYGLWCSSRKRISDLHELSQNTISSTQIRKFYTIRSLSRYGGNNIYLTGIP